MSSTGTRPPLFDPDPEPQGFDSPSARPQFPQRRPSGAPGYPHGRSGGGSSSSPRWVRPFIFGGLVLVAVLSLVSILMGDDASQTATSQPLAPPTAAVSAAAVPGDIDDVPPPGEVDAAPVVDDLATEGSPAVAAGASQDLDSADTDTAGTDTDADGAGEEAAEEGAEEGAARPTGVGSATGGGAVLTPELQVVTAFAVQFAHDYLNYDQARPDVRERDLRAYLAPDLDPQLGWDGQGTQLAVLTVPIETVAEQDRVVVTVAAQVTGQDAPRWVHLAVPLAQDDAGRWAVIAQPAYVPRPGPGNPSTGPGGEVDQSLSSTLTPGMEQLFQAYASEGAVAVGGVTAPGASIRGLQGQVTFVEVDAVRVSAEEDEGTRTGWVTVTWDDAVTGGSISQTYVVDLVRSDERWLVEAVSVG